MFVELKKKEWYTHYSQKGNKKTIWAELETRLLEQNVLNNKTHKHLILYKYIQTSSFITLSLQSTCNTIEFKGKIV